MAVVALDVEMEALQEEMEVQKKLKGALAGKMLDPDIDKLQSLYRKAIVDHPVE